MNDLSTADGSMKPAALATDTGECLTTMHMTADIRNTLGRYSDAQLGHMFLKSGTQENIPAAEVRRLLNAMLQNGYGCVPTCDNYDNTGICRGHPKKPLRDSHGNAIGPGVLVDIRDGPRGIVLYIDFDAWGRKKREKFVVVADRCDMIDDFRDQNSWDWVQRCSVDELTVVGGLAE